MAYGAAIAGARGIFGLVCAVLAGCVAQASVHVDLLSASRTVSPGDVAIHVFSVSNSGATPVEAALRVEIPPDWGHLGVPARLVLAGGGDDAVFVTLIVPRTAAAGAYAVRLLVAWAQGEARATGEVRVLSVAGVALTPPAAGTARPGESATYRIGVANRGNVLDRVAVEAVSSHGWTVRISPREMTLRPGESGTTELVLTIPAQAEPGRDLLSVAVRSVEGAEARAAWYTTVLPPGPEAIVGTVLSSLDLTLGGRLGYDLVTGRRLSLLTLIGDGEVLGGALDLRLELTGPWGPVPYAASRLSLRYVADHAWAEVGEVGLEQSSLLLSLGGQGMAGGVASDQLAVALLTGWQGDEGRFALRGVWSGASGSLGMAMHEVRGAEHVHAGALWVAGLLLEGLTVRGEGAAAVSLPYVDAGFLIGIEAHGGTHMAFQADAYGVGPRVPSPRADRAGISLGGQLTAEPWGLRFSTRWERDNVVGVARVPTVVRSDLAVALDWASPSWPVALFGNLSLRRSQGFGPGFSLNRGTRVFELAAVVGDSPFTLRLTGRWWREEDTIAATEANTEEYSQRLQLSLGKTQATLSLTQAITRSGSAIASAAAQVSLAVRAPMGITADLRHSRVVSGVGIEVPLNLSPALSAAIRVDALWDASGNATSLNASARFEYAFALDVPFLPARGWLEGMVFVDDDEDRTRDFGGEGIDGAVLAAGGRRVSSGSGGRFLFPPLVPGRYDVTLESLPPGLRARVEFPVAVEVPLAGRTMIHIPCERLGEISGSVFDDVDRSGAREAGETGLARARVVLERDGAIVEEAFTNPLGRFSFTDLPGGAYGVRLDQSSLPERYELTTPGGADVSLMPGVVGEVLFGSWQRPRPVVVVHRPPVAEFEWSPRSPRAGEPVDFDAGASDGTIVAYEWDITGDGSFDVQGVRVVWTFNKPGLYLVTLVVTDDVGLSAEADLLVRIAP